jgi:transposase
MHIQDRFRAMSYGNEHENSYLRTYAFSGGARGARGRSSLLRSLRTPPLPDTFSQCSRRARTTDSQKPGVRTANSARRHPRLQQARAGCSQSDLLATHRGPRRLRRAECALSAGAATPLSEGIRQTEYSLDAQGCRRGELRGGTYERASERGDHPSYAFAAGSALGAGQALDREPRSTVRPKKGARDWLILLAESHPQWALGFEDETWFSRFERPALRSWSDDTKPIRLLEKEAKKDDPEPKALSCYGLYLPELKETWLRFVDGRPVSSITTQFLSWCCHRLRQRGKEALLLIWDNASWHKSHEVRGWISAHNRCVKASGHGVRIVPCLLPTKSPWLNAIEPQWIHGKRKVVETERLLGAYELAERVCKVFGCTHEEHLSIPQEVA